MAPPKTKAVPETTAVKALVPVNYDGTLFGPGLPDGDGFDCRTADLKQLKDVGAIEEAPVATDTAGDKTEA